MSRTSRKAVTSSRRRVVASTACQYASASTKVLLALCYSYPYLPRIHYNYCLYYRYYRCYSLSLLPVASSVIARYTTCVYMYVYMYMYVCVCVYVYMYIYI